MGSTLAVPAKYRDHWEHPWRRKAKRSPGFRRWLNRHGRLSPHFTVEEARSADGAALRGLTKTRARNHAFDLERLRHELGDRPVPVVSWHRSKAHNQAVHGARNSRHVKGDATDHPREWVERVGRARVLNAADRVFAKGGVGVYPGGSIHLDSRGSKARWTDWVRT